MGNGRDVFVSRDPYNNCEFPPCRRGCPSDKLKCPDGSYVRRDSKNNCEFPECRHSCPKDVALCPDSKLKRNPSDNCNFRSSCMARDCNKETKRCSNGAY